MKIKEVCEKTGLTDRTIRYYIENGLLNPASRESYAGRRRYTFTEDDVATLEKIKLLRRAGFSIEQIKRLQTDRQTRAVVRERLAQLKEEQIKGKQILEALQKTDGEYSMEELVSLLRFSCASQELRDVDEHIAPLKKRWHVSRVWKVGLAGILAVLYLLAAVGVLPKVQLSTWYGYHEWKIVGMTSAEIEEEYGNFDGTRTNVYDGNQCLTPDADGIYRDAIGWYEVHDPIKHLLPFEGECFRYEIYFDENGVAYQCLQTRGWRGG